MKIDDAELMKEFHDAARKQKSRIYMAAALVLLLAGLAAVAVYVLTAEPPPTAAFELEPEGPPIRVLGLGGLLLAGAALSGWRAYQIGSGRVDDA